MKVLAKEHAILLGMLILISVGAAHAQDVADCIGNDTASQSALAQ